MTNFDKVAQFNDLIGNLKGDPLNPDWDALERQANLILEEVHEILDAIATRDMKELRDGIGDTLVTAYGLAHRAGVDANKDFDTVHVSNMSKFCKDRDEALQTAAHYEKLGVQISYRNVEGNMIAVISACDQTDINGKFYPEGKLMKSVQYHLPELDHVI
jgi:predicted HAD superfamily Cof-like phosphohydrolase